MARRTGRRTREYRVFLSHSSQDRWICEVMREKMEEQNVRAWLDVFDLPGGANLKARIKEGMLNSDECLILLSPASRHSDWVRHEAGMSHILDRWTTVILLHVTEADIPETFRDLKYLSINEFPAYLEQLVARAHGRL